MKRTFVLLFALLLATAAPAAGALEAGAGAQYGHEDGAAGCEFPVTATDATNTDVTVEERPERVVVLGASAAQTMWEIGGESQVVGMPKKPYTAYLNGSENRTEVTGQEGYANVEQVLSTDPDLVLASNINRNETIDRIREAGVTVYKFEFASSIEDIYAKTNLTAHLTGNCEDAGETVARMQERVGAVERAVEGEDRPTVFFRMGGGYTALPGTFIHDVVTTAGGQNIAEELNTTGYGQVSLEAVVDANPDWIVVQYTGEPPANPASGLPAALNNTTAVREGQVVAVNANYVSQPAPRVVQPLTKLAKAFHPEAYAAANRTTTTATSTEAAGENETTTGETETTAAATTEAATQSGGNASDGPDATDETSGDGIPGFGPLAAFAGVAIAAGALVARGRR